MKEGRKKGRVDLNACREEGEKIEEEGLGLMRKVAF